MTTTIRDDKLVDEAGANEVSPDRLALEPLTPELALVDPELARRARDRLPGPSREVPPGIDERAPRSAARSQPTPADDASAEVAPPGTRERQPERPAPRHRLRKGRLLAVGLLAATAVLSVLTWTRSSSRDARGDPAAVRSTQLAPARQQATTTAPVSPETSTHSTTPNGVGKKRAKPSPSRPRTRAKSTRPANGAKPAAPGASTHPSKLAKKPAKPSPPTAFGTRVFIWAAQEHVTLYKVAFFRHGKEVFEALRSVPRLELPLRWTYKHRKFRLTSGKYSWTVRPAFGPRTQLRYGKPIVQSTWIAGR